MDRAERRGFTLIELMIVVVIIGVVAAIAIVVYRKRVNAAKTTEAVTMIGDIRTAQERYKAEVGTYADVSNSITSLYPAAMPGHFEKQWGGACGNCNANQSWANLNVMPSTPVRFGYATVAGDSTVDPDSKAGGLKIGNNAVTWGVKPTGPWFAVYAEASGPSCKAIGSSFTNRVEIDDQCD